MTVFQKPHALTDAPFHYCPGCTHGIIHRLVAEVVCPDIRETVVVSLPKTGIFAAITCAGVD